MKVLVTGANGQLGHDVMNELRKRGHQPIGTDIIGEMDYVLDITKEDVVSKIEEIAPEAIIHCAAWTAVDAAEDEENKETVLSTFQLPLLFEFFHPMDSHQYRISNKQMPLKRQPQPQSNITL